jgi:ATP-dependent RNA helicase RhlE
LDFSDLNHLVIDECDRLLSLGFVADLLKIRSFLPRPTRVGDRKVTFQTLMFTATLVPEIHQIVLKFASKHELIDLNRDMSPNKNSRPEF